MSLIAAFNTSALTQYHHLIAGTTAGLVTTGALYPLELVKMRMQVFKKEAGYGTTKSSIHSVLRKEGIVGLFRGIAPALVASAGSWGGYFYIYELLKERKLQSMANVHSSKGKSRDSSAVVKTESQKLGVKDHLLSGIQAGVMLVFIFNPVFLIKTRLALQGADPSKVKYKGGIDAFRTIFREEGIRGLYQGLLPAILLTSHGAVQFATYEYMKDVLLVTKKTPVTPVWLKEHVLDGPVQPLILGGISKIIASTTTYPYQVIKSRLMQRGVNGVYKYKGTLDCIVSVWRENGVRGFFRGLAPNLIKVAPGSALTFVVYEETLKYLRRR